MDTNYSEVARLARAAAGTINGTVAETPLRYSQAFSDASGAEVYFKLESEQHTGSFKLRGATNALMNLSPQDRETGCVAASSGNHGAAMAYAMHELGINGVIFVPEHTTDAKTDVIRRYGGNVQFFGQDGLDTEQHAREYANEHGMYYVSPYNDLAVVAGQGTCGVEIANQLPDLDAAIIAIGGGGLMAGVGAVLKRHNPDIRMIGCQPAASPVLAKSIEAGRILDLPSDPTLSDGTAGGVEADAITFDLCRDVVDEFVLVSEAQIAAAMRAYMNAEGSAVEGAAGVAIATLDICRDQLAGRKVVVVVCGRNVSDQTLDTVRRMAGSRELPDDG